MKKILIMYHLPQRELRSCNDIAKRIQEISTEVEVKVSPLDFVYPLCYPQDVILTVPPRDERAASQLTYIKLFTGAKIISLETEGLYDLNNEEQVSVRIGTNYYSPNLIDQYIYWGLRTSEVCGRRLVKDKKITDLNRVRTCGYVPYEAIDIGERSTKKYEQLCHQYKKMILVVTGFPNADVTIKEMEEMSAFNDRDERKGVEQRRDAEKAILLSKEYRRQYIDLIKAISERFRNYLLVVKLHPTEIYSLENGKSYLYKELRDIDNIIVIDKPEPISEMMKAANLFIHYGSTSGLEAYIYKVPSVYISMKNPEKIKGVPGGNALYPSNVELDLYAKKELLDIVEKGVEFRRIPGTEKVLKDYFNFDFEKKYEPTKWIADIILEEEPPQKLSIADELVKEAFDSFWCKLLAKTIVKTCLEKLMRGKWGIRAVVNGLLAALHLELNAWKRYTR